MYPCVSLYLKHMRVFNFTPAVRLFLKHSASVLDILASAVDSISRVQCTCPECPELCITHALVQAMGSRQGLKKPGKNLLHLDDDALSCAGTPPRDSSQSRFFECELDRGRNGPVGAGDGLNAAHGEASGELRWTESRETFKVAQGAFGHRLLGRRQIPILEGGFESV